MLGILENIGNQREGIGNRDGQQDGGIFRDRSFFLFSFCRCVHVRVVSLKACHAAVFVYRVAVTNGCPRGIT